MTRRKTEVWLVETEGEHIYYGRDGKAEAVLRAVLEDPALEKSFLCDESKPHSYRCGSRACEVIRAYRQAVKKRKAKS